MASAARGPSANPFDDYQNPTVESDEIDADDASLDDLDDPLSPANARATSSTAPLTPHNLTSQIPGVDRRAPTNTLDESVWDTLKRDIFAVWAKMKEVLYPRFTWKKWPDASELLEGGNMGGGNTLARGVGDWDLWGPLVFCLLLSLFLSFAAAKEQKTEVFAGVFAMVWVGEAVVTLQIKLLGANISFFQSVCIIGYTLFPLVICALLAALRVHTIIRLPVFGVLYLWSLAAGLSILGGSGVVQNRVGLAVFPLGVFYAALVTLCLVS